MKMDSEVSVLRVRRFYKKGDRPRKYRNSFEAIDERTQEVMAICDLVGQAVFATTDIIDHAGLVWQMKPNRRIMPSRWTVTDPHQAIAMQFDQKILGKVVNPIRRTVMALQNARGDTIYRLADTRTGLTDRVLRLGPDDWTLYSGDTPVAKLGRLPQPTKPAKGLFGRLRNMLTVSDRAIISAGYDHVLPAPVALSMLLLFDELTDTSGG